MDEFLDLFSDLLSTVNKFHEYAELKKYTVAEVAKHNSRESIWVIIDGRVYDLTRYVDKHPGGHLMIENMAGKDCLGTDAFANYHTARVYKHMLPPMLIGEAGTLASVLLG
ncbi:Cytochrome B5 isoform D [Symbiodinium microadriaticum]|uniref:Cytochrome B5 isoform D n=1 Tax=Symbiodinium microadriaticum TaxID=2951 RepID=A0A1Q9DSZ7_SYMMI|nr:Cytochrome B5 isoform D [Symbiodinium microadriaticum]